MDAQGLVGGSPRRVVAAILAGGDGKRLGGATKALIEVGGRRIVDRQLAVLSGVFVRVMVVAADRQAFADLEVEVVADRVPRGAGPLAGLDAALAGLAPDEDAVFCVAADMPFLQTPLLAFMRDHRPDVDALAVRTAAGAEPLFARYRRGVGSVVERRLREGRLKMADLLDVLGAAYLDEPELRRFDPDLLSLRNVNTPDDLRFAEGLA